ncbi:MAG TPA: pitrilysin family protein [Patescibacteria group bacterium]|nr:pitrilysin family protein [Patescibacteria group bacterium]
MQTDFNISTLPNGLRVVSVPMDTKSIAVLVLIGAGSRYEDKQENGIAHFLEHMMFKGTKNRPSALLLAQELEGMGAAYNAYTAKDQTGYWIKAAAHHKEKLLDILSDMTLHSLLSSEEIEREKGVITEEINMYEDMPIRKIGSIYEELLYGDTPLGRDIAGTKETVLSFKRNDFTAYMDRFYRPNHAVVVIAGARGISQDEAERYFGAWQQQPVSSFDLQKESQSKPQIRINAKKTEQTHLCLGFRAFGLADPRRYVLGLLSVVLGGGMSSRLFHEVRERRGLAYYIRTSTSKYQDVGNLVAQAGIDHRKVEEAVKVIQEEYYKMSRKNSGITDEELKRAKEFVKGHFILSLEDSHEVASLMAESLILEGRIRTPEEIISGIDAVNTEEVTLLAGELFTPGRINLAGIGPFDKKAEDAVKACILP